VIGILKHYYIVHYYGVMAESWKKKNLKLFHNNLMKKKKATLFVNISLKDILKQSGYSSTSLEVMAGHEKQVGKTKKRRPLFSFIMFQKDSFQEAIFKS
jgi:hypothetical protein